MKESSYTITPITPADEDVLWQMLFYAAHMDEEPGQTIENVQAHEQLAQYVRGWGRDGDLGYMAKDTQSSKAIGAVWIRLYEQNQSYSTLDEQTPELAIAVLPEYIGQGIGTNLMREMMQGAAQRHTQLALNVRADNPALCLYQRLGFYTVREMQNRVGTLSYDMICHLHSS